MSEKIIENVTLPEYKIKLRLGKAILPELLATVLWFENTDDYKRAKRYILSLTQGLLPNRIVEPIIEANSAIGEGKGDGDAVIYRWKYDLDKDRYCGYQESYRTGRRIEGAEEKTLDELVNDYWKRNGIK